MKLVPIVEGHGDVDALPLLIRGYFPSLKVLRPLRVSRNRFINSEDEQRRYLELARKSLGDSGTILVLLDADSDCPALLAAKLTKSLTPTPGFDCRVVLAKCEFETWFLAGADCLGLGEPPRDLEEIRGAKEEVKRRLGRYSETVDQAKLTSQLTKDCDPRTLRKRSASFDKLWRELEGIARTQDG